MQNWLGFFLIILSLFLNARILIADEPVSTNDQHPEPVTIEEPQQPKQEQQIETEKKSSEQQQQQPAQADSHVAANQAQQPVPNQAQQPVPNQAQQPVPNQAQQPVPNQAQQPVPNQAQQPVPNQAQQPVPVSEGSRQIGESNVVGSDHQQASHVVGLDHQDMWSEDPDFDYPGYPQRMPSKYGHMIPEIHSHHHYGHLDEDYDEYDMDHDDGVVDEWSTLMENFIPDMLVTFRLSARMEEYYYQDFGSEPTFIRGGYYAVDGNSTGLLQFNIVDPNGEVAYRKKNNEGLFQLTTTTPGRYSFVVANTDWVGHRDVTFLIGAGNETRLNIKDVNNVQENVMQVARMLRDLHSESQYLWGRQRSQMATVQSTHSRTFWLSVFELATVCIVTVAQVYLLKGLVSHKRLF